MIAIRLFNGKIVGFYFPKIKKVSSTDDKCTANTFSQRCDTRGKGKIRIGDKNVKVVVRK